MESLSGNGADVVRVRAPGRLHLGLIDMNGSLGRRFGSIGLAIADPAFEVEMRRAPSLSADGAEAERAIRYTRTAGELIGIQPSVHVTIRSTMPAHAGFGSGTQIALAMATALGRLYGREVDPARLGGQMERGARSGIGVASFQTGGFIVDGGRTPTGGVPPVIARLAFPEDWRLVLILDDAMDGVHGPEEIAAFRALPPMTDGDVAHLCRLVLVRLLPGIAERDIASVGAGLSEIQARIGDHFAPAQGGERFASPRVHAALNDALAAGAAGVGQSSWGPTGFALVENATAAEELTAWLVRKGHRASGLRFLTTFGRNHGALVTAGG